MYVTDDDDRWELYFDLADHQPLEVLLTELTEDPSLGQGSPSIIRMISSRR